jgi:hypothetical protein
MDIAEYTDPAHNPMIAHTIILEPGLVWDITPDISASKQAGP